MNRFLSGLNPVQTQAVAHGTGPLLLLAGAGSGKTRVVTHRIARLLEDGVEPDRILAVTFTNKAAREMRERVGALLEVDSIPGLTISTFHALGARFLRQQATAAGRSRSFTIYDESDQLATIRRALEQSGVPGVPGLKKGLRRAFDAAKNQGEGAEDCTLPDHFVHLDGRGIGALYDELLERADAFDFGDLIRWPVHLLETQDRLRAAWQDRWAWVMVDEFQDTNRAQYRLLRALAPPGSNLMVVGDDDQSIYGWRGAEVGNILEFPDAWPGAEVLRLEQNYRSEGNILAAANGLIAQNTRRLGKTLWTDQAAGARVEIRSAGDARAEARLVAERIRALRAEGHRPGDVAILMRANHLSLDLEDALRRAGLPYVILRGRSFYERAIVRDALAYLRLVANPADDVAFLRAVNTPPRGVGKSSLQRLVAYARGAQRTLSDAVAPALEAGAVSGRARTGLRQFVALLEAARAAPNPVDAARTALADGGLLLESLDALGEAERDTQGHLHRLLQSLVEQVRETPEASLADFLEQVKLVSDADTEAKDGAISMMTVHAAKGLEFPVVVVVGLEEGTFPGRRAFEDPDGIEEERRLFYVALTRARSRLLLTHANRRRSFGERSDWRDPSRFLRELPEAVLAQSARGPVRRPRLARRSRVEAPADDVFPDEVMADEEAHLYRPGMPVWHSDLGVGLVVKVKPGMNTSLDINFPDVGIRTVMARYVSPYEG